VGKYFKINYVPKVKVQVVRGVSNTTRTSVSVGGNAPVKPKPEQVNKGMGMKLMDNRICEPFKINSNQINIKKGTGE
jgi:hypothetical protein